MTATSKPSHPTSPTDPSELAALADWYATHSSVTDGVDDNEGWLPDEPVADPTVVRSVRLRRSTVARLAEVASARDIGPTELIRLWVEERLEAEASPTAERTKLTLLRGLADALVREAGIPGLRIDIRTGGESASGTGPRGPRAVPGPKAAPARKAAPTRKTAAANSPQSGRVAAKKSAASSAKNSAAAPRRAAANKSR